METLKLETLKPCKPKQNPNEPVSEPLTTREVDDQSWHIAGQFGVERLGLQAWGSGLFEGFGVWPRDVLAD